MGIVAKLCCNIPQLPKLVPRNKFCIELTIKILELTEKTKNHRVIRMLYSIYRIHYICYAERSSIIRDCNPDINTIFTAILRDALRKVEVTLKI